MLNAECRVSLPLEGKVLNESEADEVEIPENIDGNTSSVSLRLPPSPTGKAHSPLRFSLRLMFAARGNVSDNSAYCTTISYHLLARQYTASGMHAQGKTVINAFLTPSRRYATSRGRLVGSGSARPKSPLQEPIFAGGSEPEIPRCTV